MPFQFFSYEFRGLIVIFSWFLCYCLLVLGHFWFCTNKKHKKVSMSTLHQLWVARASNSGDCNDASTTLFDSSDCPIPLRIAHIGGSARFDQNWLFSFFLFLLFLPKITCWPREKLYQLINLFIFFGFSPSFIYNFLYLHWLFLSGFYIWFHPCSFDFLILFFKFGTPYLNCYLFCFESFSWLIFFTILPPDIYFHLPFASNLVMLFSNYFLNGLVFYNSIYEYLISFDFMSNLVLIISIAIFLHRCFLLILFSISCLDICLVKNLASLFFGFAFDGVTLVSWLGS